MTEALAPLRRALHLTGERASISLVRGQPHQLAEVAQLLRTFEPAFFAHPSCTGLAEAPDGALCLVGIDEDNATWLNLHRNAVSTRQLRVVLFGAPGLSLRRLAPDLDSWTRVWIDLPNAPPTWTVSRLRAAVGGRVRWLGGDLDGCASAAWPELPRLDVDSDAMLRLEPQVLDRLRNEDGVLVVGRVDCKWARWHLQWALAAWDSRDRLCWSALQRRWTASWMCPVLWRTGPLQRSGSAVRGRQRWTDWRLRSRRPLSWIDGPG